MLADCLATAGTAGAAPQQGGPTAAPEDGVGGIQITSPLGRTGLVTKERIVARVHVPPGTVLSPLTFYVDGKLVGTVASGPPYAVDWTDENPFEPREIVVQAADAAGNTIKDKVVLPPFEITDSTDVTSILLEIGVYDKNGRSVAQLEPSAFVVRENGVQQGIDLVTRETLPTTIVLLVDNSQSMSRRIDFVRLAAARLGAALRQRDKVIVVPFNAHIGTITGPTNDAATITGAIDAMRANGGTAILDSVRESARLLEGVEGRRAIILITDGYDENSTAKTADVLKSVKEADITVYGVGVGGIAGISLKGEAMLRSLADETGGRVFFPPREPDLMAVSDAVAADAHGRYLVTYTPENQRHDGTWREVAVDVPDGYHVRTRPGYFAPAPPPIRPFIEFTATNQSREFTDVAAGDLDVVEDGVAQAVDTFQDAVDPVSIVMALDASGSMKKSAEAVRETAREFVLAVRPEDSLALMTFADEVQFAHPLATNRQPTLDAIGKYIPDGGTALYDALWTSLEQLKAVNGRRAIAVLTDGRDENNPGTAPGSVHTLADVLALTRQTGATIFPIGLGTNVDRPVLEQLATESGGEVSFVSDASLLGDEFGRIIENLRRRYVVSYTSTNSARDGAWRTVQIRSRVEGMVVTTQGGYFAPQP